MGTYGGEGVVQLYGGLKFHVETGNSHLYEHGFLGMMKYV